MHAVAGEAANAAIVHANREVDGQLALRVAEDAVHARVELQPLGRQVKSPLGRSPYVFRRGIAVPVLYVGGGRHAAIRHGWAG